jgi:penicillin-binding protein 1A
MRRPRLILAGAASLVLAVLLALQLLATGLEQRLEARIAAEAAQLGALARVERVQVALWPPLRLTGVVIEKPGAWQAHLDSLTARLRLRGRSGLGPFVHVSVGPATVSLPGELELRLNPAEWDWDGSSAAELVAPTDGLSLRVVSGPEGRRIELEAKQLDSGRIGEVRLEQSSVQPGPVNGELLLESGVDRGLRARWRVQAIGAESSGTASVARSAEAARLELGARVDRLDFARLFAALGLELPFRSVALGSLRAVVGASGPLDAPASIAVTQQLDFTAPPKLPAALLRLQDAFVHEVTGPDGARLSIDVSPDSPDFVARGDVPPLFEKALLLAEDAAFFSHRGLDLTELPKALTANWARGGAVRGASTITQQLAKNLFLSREKSLRRKLQELALAFLLESALGKDRILEIYLNVIEWGPALHGLRPAARHYFGKDPSALSPKEIAFLVVLIPGPVKYQRSFNEGALTSGLEPLVTNLLAKLRSVDALSEEEYLAARSETLEFRRP